MRFVGAMVVVLGLVVGTTARAGAGQTKAPAGPANPVLVFDTLKGSFEIELFQSEAPKSVEHILDLMKRNFYRAQRFHRVTANLVQFGDPQSRDMSKEAYWGTGGSGRTIGVFELSKKRSNVRGSVGLAHGGQPTLADSQLYIDKTDQSGNDGKYAIVGRVSTGMAVVDKLVKTDIIKDARIK
jgi:peptidyl-prolyl cis-trans isomerase B (cyclophilin B)